MMNRPQQSLGDALRDALPTHEAPESLRAWAIAQARGDAQGEVRSSERMRTIPRTMPRIRTLAYAAGLLVAASLGWSGGRLIGAASGASERQNVLVASLVDSHVRSLMADHLTDVLSSDHHTVKPWFAGKIAFAPAVPELQAQGFPLVGGRVEYIAGHTAAALVYARGLHKINLFIWPGAADNAPPATSYNGYALVHWTDRGLSYWAISDAAAAELTAFERAYQAASTP